MSVLNLTLASGRTLMDLWRGWLGDLRAADNAEAMEVALVSGGAAPAPTGRGGEDQPWMRIVREPRGYRGPAGVARDVCLPMAGGGSDVFFVADAGRALWCDLASLWREHAASAAEVTVVREADGSPSGLYFASRRSLEVAQRDGYQDVKEQWLPGVVSRDMRVRVHTLSAQSGSWPLRTLEDALTTAKRLQGSAAPGDIAGRVAEDNRVERLGLRGVRLGPTSRRAGLCVIEPGAAVSDDAVIFDSIVMPGAIVERNAVVARSMVCPGSRVEVGARVVDSIVGLNAVESAGGWAAAKARP